MGQLLKAICSNVDSPMLIKGVFKGSLTVRGVGMFMSLFERNYKV